MYELTLAVVALGYAQNITRLQEKQTANLQWGNNLTIRCITHPQF